MKLIIIERALNFVAGYVGDIKECEDEEQSETIGKLSIMVSMIERALND